MFKRRSLFLPLLKVAFFARQKPQTALNHFILSAFDGRFSISWIAFNLWLLKSATAKLFYFDRPYFQKWCKVINYELRQRPEQLLLEKLRSKSHETKTFYSVISLEAATLCFRSQDWVFQLLGCAGFLFSGLEVVTQHLSQLSHHCITYRMSAWSEELEQATFSSYGTVEITSDVFRLTCVLRKTQLYRMLSSYVLRAIRLFSGFAVAIKTNWYWIWSQSKLFGSMRLQ